ncbi:MAG: HD domain-containing protein [Actinomycetota bacterium]|nr:HD domain-containing protein [Actinomycetota bacterium]
MAGLQAADGRRPQAVRRVVVVLLFVALLACCVVALLDVRRDRFGPLSGVLAAASLTAGLTFSRSGNRAISSSFIVMVLAAGFLGPASAFAAGVLAELAILSRCPSPPRIVLMNLVGGAGPGLAGAFVIRALAWPPSNSARFYLAVGAGGLVVLALNYLIVAPIHQLFRGERAWSLRTYLQFLPSLALNAALAVAGASIYLKVGIGGIVFALVAVFAFSYMAHLVTTAEHRAEQYRDLSWGVLAGLVRALDARDQRAARHSAAVARFARDLARATGMSERDCELAHTAGLLHDIGRFALSDRVSERGRTLSEEDWEAIQRHPALGADMLRDLGVYGPVADIVLSHHERVDGRGYPRALTMDEIPELAKIIAVAEVYDTLTAQDTYRTRVSSFEALRELRRVAGTQLDSRYVEAFADLLAGEGVDYRHADDASFDAELDIERRIKDAVQG